MTPAEGNGGTRRDHSRLQMLALVLILAVSAFVQATAVSQTEVINPLRADSGEYFSYAFNLREYGVYSITPTWNQPTKPAPPAADDLRPPGYPLFLAAISAPEPSLEYVNKVLYAQAALAVFCVLLTYLVAASVVSRGQALCIALVTAITPHFATISTNLLSEGLFVFLLLLSVLALIRAVNSQRRQLYVAAGLLLGICTLVRLTTLYLPAVLLLAVLAVPRLRAYRANALLATACFLVAFLPWTVRSHQAGVANVGSGLMVKTLLHGSYPNFEFNGRPETFAFPYRFDPEAERISRDLPSVLGHIATQFRDHPFESARWYLIGKPFYFLSWGGVQAVDILIYPVTRTPFYDRPLFSAMRLLTFAVHWPLMISGVLGAFLLLFKPRWIPLEGQQRAAASIVAAVVVYAIAFHVVAAPLPRYSIPFRPLIFTLAVLPWRAAWLARSVRQAGTLDRSATG